MQAAEDGNAKSKPDFDPATLTLEDLRPHYCERTIHEASDLIGVGLTALKRRCRALGIRRWPFRQLSSTKKMIDVFKKWGEEDLDPRQRFHQQDGLDQLLEFYNAVQLNPNQPVDEEQVKRIWRMRQALFKDKHKMKKSGAQSSIAPAQPLTPNDDDFLM